MNDFRFALRQLLKNPAFTAVAIITIAVGVGGNTAIFSVVNAVMLKALPYFGPSRIVMLWTDNPSLNLGFHELPPAPPDLLDWRRQSQSFEQIAAFRTRLADLSDQGDPERVGGVQSTANLFALLGAQPLLGRVFSVDEERPGSDKVAVISHSLWQRRFGGQTNIIGQSITINHECNVVIGVMPPGFNFPRGTEMPAGYALMAQTDVWRPYSDTAEYWRNDDTRDFIAMARLRSGLTLTQAQSEMTAIARHEAENYPKTHTGWTVHLLPLALQVEGKTRPVLFILLGAVAFVLLIACANVANLLLCRSASRRKEIAVRVAIGAGRGRIIRQLLTESLLLSVLGGGIGFLLGGWAVQVILALSPPNIPRLQETTLDARVFLFSFFISLLAGVLFGLAPVWHASRVNLTEALNADNRSGTATGRHRAHGLLVTAEVALAILLLTGAGLMLESLVRLQSVDLGFRPQRVAAFDITLQGANYEGYTRQRQFYRQARERLTSVPGVRSVAAISELPLGGVENLNFFFVEGASAPPTGQEPFAETRKITPRYFETMEVSLLGGRDFSDHDTPGQPYVCIVNETLARAFFSGANPIGKRLKIARTDDPQHPWFIIVGVVRDVRSYGLDVKPRPQIYTTVEQNTDNVMTFVARASYSPVALLERPFRTQMKSLDPALPLANFRTMEGLVADAISRPRFSTVLLVLFAVTALLLTAVGLYGVVAYATTQRTREIGIRVALGASGRNVLTLILGQGMFPAIAGLAIGLVGAFALTRLLANQLYEIKATDPMTFLGATTLLLLVVLAACWLPARRATKINPVDALRYE
jgi:putative ABC transport system permease protein